MVSLNLRIHNRFNFLLCVQGRSELGTQCTVWINPVCSNYLLAFVVNRMTSHLEAEESNETPSSEEDQDMVVFNPDLSIKQSISSSRKTISQIIKDKKKQTQLTLQW